MAEKNYAEVIIGGKVITIGGKQDEEYLRKVASYLNGKIEALQKKGAFKRLDPDTRAILTASKTRTATSRSCRNRSTS